MKILAFNAGSSSVKAALHDLEGRRSSPDATPPVWRAHANWDPASGKGTLRARTNHRGAIEQLVDIASPGDVFPALIQSLRQGDPSAVEKYSEIDAVGHRVVHGGAVFCNSTLLTAEARRALAGLEDLAPAHNRFELEGVETVSRLMGQDTKQVAVFDTAFHASLPPAAYVYPGPYAWLEKGIRRYGFHGISHHYAANRAAKLLGRELKSLRLISCHLGNGCSLAAISEGRSVDTTMGFTTLDGLMMGARSGSIDPGIPLYLMRHLGYSADQMDRALNYESGLLGVSGISSDMREILTAKAKGNARAQLAFDVFVHSVRSHIGRMLASVGEPDALIFTAGIGENCPAVRAAVCKGFPFLDLELDAGANGQCGEGDISAPQSGVRIMVIPAQEEWEIARECFDIVTGAPAAGPA